MIYLQVKCLNPTEKSGFIKETEKSLNFVDQCYLSQGRGQGAGRGEGSLSVAVDLPFDLICSINSKCKH